MDRDVGRTARILRVPAAPLANQQPWERRLASLESAQTGERRGFADLASLFAFLEEQMGGDASQDDRLPSTRR